MLDFFITPAYAQAATSESNPIFQLLIFGGLFLLMYLLLIRPQRKRQKEHQQLVNSLSVGDEVVLTSGMLGKITTLDDHYVSVKAGKDNNKAIELSFQRQAVHAVLPKGTIKGIA